MTAVDEAALARDEAAVALARDTIAMLASVLDLLSEFAAQVEAAAERADYTLAGGAPPKWVAKQMITANLAIAAAARGEAEVTR